jgi:hypothetical protein
MREKHLIGVLKLINKSYCNIYIMNNENFVFMKEGNKVMAGGYEVDSAMLREGLPAIGNIQKGGGGLDTLAVPAGLFLLQQHVKGGPNPYVTNDDSPSVIGDDLYDKLLSLMTTGDKKKKKRFTRRKKSSAKRRTRRSR